MWITYDRAPDAAVDLAADTPMQVDAGSAERVIPHDGLASDGGPADIAVPDIGSGSCFWRQGTYPDSVPRMASKLVAIGDTVYLYGGGDSRGNAISDFYSYSVADGWTRICGGSGGGSSCPPDRRAGHVFVAMEGQLMITGGETVEFGGVSDNKVWVFDTQRADARWEELTDKPAPVAFDRALAAYDRKRRVLVVYGGLIGGVPQRTTWELNRQDWSWTKANITTSKDLDVLYDGGSAMTYVPDDGPAPLAGQVVLYGGGYSQTIFGASRDAIWGWNGSRWIRYCEQCTHIPRLNAAVVYHPGRKQLLIAGGFADPNANFGFSREQSGTWLYVGAPEALQCDAVDPPQRDTSAITAFQAGGEWKVMLLGGNGGICGPPNATTAYQHNCDDVFIMD